MADSAPLVGILIGSESDRERIQPALDELEKDATKVLAALTTTGAPRVSESATPEDIRARFGLSKKAFKRAVGRLLKERAVTIDGEGFVRPLPSTTDGGKIP